MDGAGVILAFLFLAGIHRSGWVFALGLFALFLGVTNFGRQCPLILSVKQLAYRIKLSRRSTGI
jgi:hypothetical protein